MSRPVLLAFVLAAGAAGCGGSDDPPGEPALAAAPVPDLTPTAAKAALVALVESGASAELRWVDLRFQRAWEVRESDGQATGWGPFALDLGARAYSFELRSGPPTRVCTERYCGEFAFQGERWVALSPRLVMTSLGPG